MMTEALRQESKAITCYIGYNGCHRYATIKVGTIKTNEILENGWQRVGKRNMFVCPSCNAE